MIATGIAHAHTACRGKAEDLPKVPAATEAAIRAKNEWSTNNFACGVAFFVALFRRGPARLGPPSNAKDHANMTAQHSPSQLLG